MYVFNADFLVLMSFEIITFKNILIAFFSLTLSLSLSLSKNLIKNYF